MDSGITSPTPCTPSVPVVTDGGGSTGAQSAVIGGDQQAVVDGDIAGEGVVGFKRHCAQSGLGQRQRSDEVEDGIVDGQAARSGRDDDQLIGGRGRLV